MTDGCISKKDYGHVLNLSLQERDSEHLSSFKTFLQSEHPIIKKDNSAGYGMGQICIFHVHCPDHLASSLIALGVTPRKTKTADAGNLATNKHFWRGCIDGDGTVSIHRSGGKQQPFIMLCSDSKTLIEQFSAFVRSICPGHPASIKLISRVLTVRVYGTQAIRLVRHLYGDEAFGLSRKVSTANEIMRQSNVDPDWCNGRTSEKTKSRLRAMWTEEHKASVSAWRKGKIDCPSMPNKTS